MGFARLLVILPTRKRLDTLKKTLDSCLSQNYPNMAIHVLSNASPDTDEYVRGLGDARVTLHVSGSDLPMKDNWERIFNIEIEDDDYVFFLGDDDALLPDALSLANHIIEETGSEILSWKKAEYCWPTMIVGEYQNFGYIPLSTDVYFVRTKDFLNAVHNHGVGYDQGPSIYASFVRMGLLRSLKLEVNGSFFASGSPDVFSSYALATAVEKFLRCGFPLSINGASRHSNGIGSINDFEGVSSKEFSRSFELHPSLVSAPSVYIAEADALLRARDSFSQRFSGYTYSYTSLLSKLVEEARSLSGRPRAYALWAAAVEIARRNNLPEVVVEETVDQQVELPVSIAYGYSPSPASLTLNLSMLGVSDVEQAAKIFGAIDPLANKQWKIVFQPRGGLLWRLRTKIARILATGVG